MVSSEFGYQKSEVAVHSGGSQSGGGESWREHLEKFVKNVKGTEKFPARTVRIAEAILNGRYTERPPLMVPPEPDAGQNERIQRLKEELNSI